MVQLLSSVRCFGGLMNRYAHTSKTVGTEMKFAVFLPNNGQTAPADGYPALYWLSGLTCTDENFTQKAGGQRAANAHNVALILPDTSPRGAQIPGEDDSYDFGTGAGFYLNATQSPWSKNYHMYDYVTKELPEAIAKNFPINTENASSEFLSFSK
jgi:S-formylglutathione hydrolase